MSIIQCDTSYSFCRQIIFNRNRIAYIHVYVDVFWNYYWNLPYRNFVYYFAQMLKVIDHIIRWQSLIFAQHTVPVYWYFNISYPRNFVIKFLLICTLNLTFFLCNLFKLHKVIKRELLSIIEIHYQNKSCTWLRALKTFSIFILWGMESDFH